MALPVVDINAPGVKELIQGSVKDIANTIFASASISITAAAKAVTPSIPEMIGDITEDLRAGPVNRFSQGLEKLDKLLQNFGGDIKDYSAELAKFVTQREARINKSETTIRELRENNVKAEISDMGEIKILSQFEIQQREEAIEVLNTQIKTDKQDLEIKRKLIQEQGVASGEDISKDVVDSQNAIIEKEKERTKLLETLNKTESDDKKTFREKFDDTIDTYVPDGLRDIGSAFTEGLTAPFTAIKDLGKTFGNMLKPLKMLPKLLKGFTVGLLGALAAMIPYLLIAAAIVIGLYALKKGFDFIVDNLDVIKEKLSNFADAVMEIPGKIADGFKTIFNKIQNFFIDAINGVIGLVNKIPGIEIEKIERKELPGEADITPGEQDAAFAAGNLDNTSVAEAQDNAFVLPPQTADNGMSFMERMKSSPVNNDYLPITSNPSSNSNAIIDNSVKTVNQNNTTQSMGISSRNDDVTIRLSDAMA